MADLDKATVRELARILDERLKAVETYGGMCPSCREAEANAFLAKLRVLAGDVVTSGPVAAMPRPVGAPRPFTAGGRK